MRTGNRKRRRRRRRRRRIRRRRWRRRRRRAPRLRAWQQNCIFKAAPAALLQSHVGQ